MFTAVSMVPGQVQDDPQQGLHDLRHVKMQRCWAHSGNAVEGVGAISPR